MVGQESHTQVIHLDTFALVPLFDMPRPGNVVLFQLPNNTAKGAIELGMILSVWRGVKQPRVFSGPVHVNSCIAFRALALSMSDEDQTDTSLDFDENARRKRC